MRCGTHAASGATHVVDLATLTGAMRAGMGDLYAGVFAPDESWRDEVVQAGNASGDLAWPWPLHPRYRPLIESTVADLRNTAGKGFGYPDRRGDVPGAVRRRRARGRMSTCSARPCSTTIAATRSAAARRGYGVRMLVELATRLSGAAHPVSEHPGVTLAR